MKKIAIILILASIALSNQLLAQTGFTFPETSVPEDIARTTITYVEREGEALKMDIYRKKSTENEVQPAIFNVHGGAFAMGARDGGATAAYMSEYARKGVTGISIQYRLLLKGALSGGAASGGMEQMLGALLNLIQDTERMESIFDAPVEDLYAATNYLLQHSKELGIDKDRIMISGSSAGAMTCLRAEYMLKNGMPLSKVLPEGFKYAGIVSFAGALYVDTGTPTWAIPHAPILFIHGSKDEVLREKGLMFGFGKQGLYSPKMYTKELYKTGTPYKYITLKGRDHGYVCNEAVLRNFDDVMDFINTYIFAHKQAQVEYTITVERDNLETRTPVEEKTVLQKH